MEDKSYETALRTQSKVGCIEQVSSYRCAATSKTLNSASNVTGLLTEEPGILYYTATLKSVM
jgi:hypothetical protein